MSSEVELYDKDPKKIKVRVNQKCINAANPKSAYA